MYERSSFINDEGETKNGQNSYLMNESDENFFYVD